MRDYDNAVNYLSVQSQPEGNMIGRARTFTKREKLAGLKAELEAHLEKVNAAISALDANPQVEDVINKIDAAL